MGKAGKRNYTPQNAVHAITHEMRALGFVFVRKSPTGSRYMRFPDGGPFILRISTHRQSGYSKQRRMETVHDERVGDDINPLDVKARALECGIRCIFKLRRRLGIVGTEIAA